MSTNKDLEGFNALHTTKGLIKVTFSDHGILFSEAALSSLHNSDYIDIFVNYKDKKIMMKSTDKPNKQSVSLRKGTSDKDNIRLNYNKLNQLIMKLMNSDTSKHNYSINGRYLSAHDATVFDLDDYKVMA